jgi:hypothetical protein
MQMTWSDLIVEGAGNETQLRALQEWRHLLGGRVAPLFLNRFGGWFLLRPEGHVDFLDVRRPARLPGADGASVQRGAGPSPGNG